MSLPNDYACEGQISIFEILSQDTWCGKTSQELSAQTTERTLDASLKKFAELRIKPPIFLDLRGGGWSKSGCIMGSDWSVAWRLHDAQFWGVPQRRKRIALVADFGGQSAPEILFEREGVSGNPEKSSDKGQEIAGSVRTSTDPSSYTLKIRGGVEVDSHGKKAGKGALVQTELSGTLGVSQDQTLITNKCLNGWDVQSKHIQPENGKAESLYSGERRYGGGESYVMQSKVYGISSYDSNAMKSPNPNSGIYEADTTRTLDNNGGNPACNQGGMIVLEGNGSRPSHKDDGFCESEVSYTLNSTEHHGVCTYQQTTGTLSAGAHAGSYNGQDAYNDMLVVDGGGTEPVTASKASFFLNARSDGTADTLVATDYKDPQIVCYGLDRASFNQGRNAQYDFSVQEELAQPLVARGPGGGVLTRQ